MRKNIDYSEFFTLFPQTSNKDLSNKYGVAPWTISKIAKECGLKKSDEYRREIQRQRSIGRVMSEESRNKIRMKAIGRTISEDTKKKTLETKIRNNSILKGERHPFWKGGRPWERFKDPKYVAWRNSVLFRDAYECQDCGRKCNKNEKGLAAHHIKEYSKYPELRFELSNGMTLCRECHMKLHGKPFVQEKIPCECGCGTLIDRLDKYGRRPRRYVNGHYGRKKC